MNLSEPNNPFVRPDDLQKLEPYAGFLALCKSAHTRSNYHQDLRVLKLFLDEASLHPASAQPRDLARFAGQLAKPGHTPAGKSREAYSTRSMKRILASTRSFYRYLAAIQSVSNDPTAVFHNLAIRSPQRNPRPLVAKARATLVQCLRLEDLEDLKISLVVLLGFHCGLRVSEITHLKIEALDLDRGLLTVIGKGDKERTVPMTDILKGHLKNYLASGQPTPASVYLFPSPRRADRPIHSHFLELWVKKAANWASFEHPEEMTVHVLRHTFGTQLAESGASVYEIRDLMGHSSITVSENYVKLASTQAQKAHQKAFGTPLKSHALNLGRSEGIPSVLRRFRTFQRKRLAGEAEDD